MKIEFRFSSVVLGIGAALILLSGCTKQQATDAMSKAEDSAKEAAAAVSQGASDAVAAGEAAIKDAREEGSEFAEKAQAEGAAVVEQGKELASDLGEKAMGYLAPLKAKFGNLESLKDSPEKLKEAVSELIESIEGRAGDIQLPESISNALATVKTKLIELKDYLQGEVEQSNVDERLEEISRTVKSSLGFSNE